MHEVRCYFANDASQLTDEKVQSERTQPMADGRARGNGPPASGSLRAGLSSGGECHGKNKNTAERKIGITSKRRNQRDLVPAFDEESDPPPGNWRSAIRDEQELHAAIILTRSLNSAMVYLPRC